MLFLEVTVFRLLYLLPIGRSEMRLTGVMWVLDDSGWLFEATSPTMVERSIPMID